MAYMHGHFVWFELVNPTIDKATAFYSEVVGWSVQTMNMGAMDYTMLAIGEAMQCGVTNPQMEGVPAQWTSYLSVDDVDAKAAAVVAAGGSILVPAMDIPNIGRFCLVADPEGATFNLFKGATDDDKPPAGFHWMELWSRDAAKAVGFYQSVFGFGVETMEMPTGTYFMLKAGEAMIGGVMNSMTEKAPPMWLPYLQADDCDAATARATAMGAQVHLPPHEVPGIGKFSIVGDNSGAAVGLIKPAARG